MSHFFPKLGVKLALLTADAKPSPGVKVRDGQLGCGHDSDRGVQLCGRQRAGGSKQVLAGAKRWFDS